MRLDREEETVLRVLVARGDQSWKDLDWPQRAAFDGLQVLGYAKRSGNNGCGQWARITKRGLLKALADGIISHHPEDPESVAMMLRKDKVRAAINR